MHDTPRPSDENTNTSEAPLEDLIADLAAGDPAEGPDIADEIAVRLEAELAAAPGQSPPAEVAPEHS